MLTLFAQPAARPFVACLGEMFYVGGVVSSYVVVRLVSNAHHYMPASIFCPLYVNIVRLFFFRETVCKRVPSYETFYAMFFNVRSISIPSYTPEFPYLYARIVQSLRADVHSTRVTPPETNIAPKNGWLEYDRFLLGWPIFWGELLVSGSVLVSICYHVNWFC